jgi:hypothetical protein
MLQYLPDFINYFCVSTNEYRRAVCAEEHSVAEHERSAWLLEMYLTKVAVVGRRERVATGYLLGTCGPKNAIGTGSKQGFPRRSTICLQECTRCLFAFDKLPGASHAPARRDEQQSKIFPTWAPRGALSDLWHVAIGAERFPHTSQSIQRVRIAFFNLWISILWLSNRNPQIASAKLHRCSTLFYRRTL